MARVIIFLSFLAGLVMVMNLKEFKGIKVQNRPFDFKATKAANAAKTAALNKLKRPKKRAKKKVKVVKATGPLVALTTPQLKSGAGLYRKCVVCHGKRGQGKKSQNAPAIGGQYDWYVEDTIVSMQRKKRINKVMYPYIKKLSPQDVKDLAAYISKLPSMGKL